MPLQVKSLVGLTIPGEQLQSIQQEYLQQASALFSKRRSQLAAALWTARTGGRARSAGTHPAPAVHRGAVAAARVEDQGVGSVSVVGTGFTAGYRVPREVRRALEELRIDGVQTTTEFHKKMMANTDFTEGRLWTGFLEKR